MYLLAFVEKINTLTDVFYRYAMTVDGNSLTLPVGACKQFQGPEVDAKRTDAARETCHYHG